MTKLTEKYAQVSRILTYSCVDGPGNRLVLFLQGCNFNCISCHNPHTINHCNHCGDCVSACPSDALQFQADKVTWDEEKCTQCDRCIDICSHSSNPKVKRMSVQEVVEIVRKHHFFLSGITVSGGEATMQLPFIIELFRQLKQDSELKRLSCYVDSNGYLPIHGWQKLLPYLDGAMIDLKAWQQETHHWLAGRSNHRVLKSVSWLAEQGKLHELRLLHIPNISDLDSEVEQLASYINTLPADVQVRLNAFQHHGVVGEALNWQKCSKTDIEQLSLMLSERIANTLILPTVYV